jgi:hypothetical protein
MGKARNENKMLVKKHEGKRLLGTVGRKILDWILQKYGVKM